MSEDKNIGHNWAAINGDAKAQLLEIVKDIEAELVEKKMHAENIRDIYLVAKSKGYDVKAIRQIVRERAQGPEERAAFASMMDVYRTAFELYD